MKFSTGQVVATPGALFLEALAEGRPNARVFSGDARRRELGEDRQANDQALVNGGRILSVYRTLKNKQLWIITEGADDEGKREATTILLPSEY